ncbi:MAG: hypothetical protein LKF36_02565 [Lactobacillus sp.]|nr:hypothetical protein [Lactobacillus sp.]
MMKNKKCFFGLLITISALFLGIIGFKATPVQASLSVQTPTDTVYVEPVNSNGRAVTVYSDPECTKPTGQTLSTAISNWSVIHFAFDSNQNAIAAFDLGNNQWVKAGDVSGGAMTNLNPNPMGFAYAYSRGQKVPIYDSSKLQHVIGYLDPNVSYWKIKNYRLTYNTDVNSIASVDLGSNQWVNATKDVDVIRVAMIFGNGTAMYNQNGQQTGTIENGTDYYKVFGATTINGETYVKLGSDDQWVKFSEGTVN